MKALKFSEIPADGIGVNLSDGDLEPIDNVKSLTMSAQISSAKNGCNIEGNVRCLVKLSCSFCMKKFDYVVDEKISELVLLKNSEKIQCKDLFVRFVSKPVLNFNELATEFINSSIPIQASCSINCLGLCSGCGVDLNFEKCSCKNLRVDNPFSILKSMDI